MQQSHKPEISVIIPAYNLAQYLGKCLDSVLAQSYPHFEAIVVDDGSTDHMGEVLHHYAAKDARIVAITTPNQGVSLARATGIAHACGEYICFLDGDDVWEPRILEELVTAIQQGEGYDVVCCNYKRICRGYQAPVRERVTQDMSGLDFLVATLCHTISVTVWGKLYRRWLFDENLRHYQTLRLGQDSVLNIQVGCRFPRVRFIDYVGYGYVQRASSSNHSGFDISYCALFCQTVEQELLRHNNTLNGRAEFYALLNKLRWFQVYLRKSRSPWAGNTEFANRIYSQVARYRSELRKQHSRGTMLMLDIYRYRWMKPAVLSVSTLQRWRISLRRRLAN